MRCDDRADAAPYKPPRHAGRARSDGAERRSGRIGASSCLDADRGDTATCALATGLGYRGSLQVVNQIAPGDQRAEVASGYFVCGFCGNALPVIGVGILSTLTSAAAASMAFAAVIICFAVVALRFSFKYGR
jgi:hypothetical protein